MHQLCQLLAVTLLLVPMLPVTHGTTAQSGVFTEPAGHPAQTTADTIADNATNSVHPFAVFGYLPEYRQPNFPFADVFSQGLTHLIFFSAEVDPQSKELIHTEDRLPQGAAWDSIRAAADQYNTKLMLCVGGGGRSAGFPAMVADPYYRTQFQKQLNTLLLERRLDGVDINWEYPQDERQWRAFARFMRELKNSLGYVVIWDDVPTDDKATSFTSQVPSRDVSEEGNEEAQERVLRLWREQQQHREFFLQEKKDGRVTRRNHRVRVRRVTLSMAVHPHPQIAALLHKLDLLPWLDYLHWMAYDHAGNLEPHSSLEYAELVLSDQYIGALSEAGAPADSVRARGHALPRPTDHRKKLTLGIPFYGRHREEMRLEPETYSHLQFFIAQWAKKRHPTWRLDGSGEEVKTLNEYTGYAFNSYRDVQAKMKLARGAGPPGGLAGVMLWELGQDLLPPAQQPLSLMRAVAEQLRQWNVSQRMRTAAAEAPGKGNSNEPDQPTTSAAGEATTATPDTSLGARVTDLEEDL